MDYYTGSQLSDAILLISGEQAESMIFYSNNMNSDAYGFKIIDVIEYDEFNLIEPPEDTRTVEEEAFMNTQLSMLDLIGLEYIGPRAFAQCDSLEIVQLDPSISIDPSAFEGCGTVGYISFNGKIIAAESAGLKRIAYFTFD